MANRNDEMDRNKNLQGSTTSNVGGTEGGFGGQGNTSQGQGGNFNQGRTPGSTEQSVNTRPGGDAINKDREMNRDREMGQGSSGTEPGRQGSFGSTGSSSGNTRGGETDKSRNTTGSDRDSGRSGSEGSE